MSKTDLVASDEKTSLLRLPANLHERIKASARAERRSMHSQMIVLLERAVRANAEADAGATASAS